MLVYSVTETVDLAGYSSIVVLEICLPANTEAAPPPNLQSWLRACSEPGRMEGWVGLLSWPVEGKFANKVVICQGRESPPVKDRRPNYGATPPAHVKAAVKVVNQFTWCNHWQS